MRSFCPSPWPRCRKSFALVTVLPALDSCASAASGASVRLTVRTTASPIRRMGNPTSSDSAILCTSSSHRAVGLHKCPNPAAQRCYEHWIRVERQWGCRRHDLNPREDRHGGGCEQDRGEEPQKAHWERKHARNADEHERQCPHATPRSQRPKPCGP